MIYFSGVPHPSIPSVNRSDIGVLLTPDMGNRPCWLGSVTAWAADNACFNNPEAFQLDRFLGWLNSMSSWRRSCLFATAPDVVGDAVATWERSAPALPLIREAGYPSALVAQDGIEHMLDQLDWSAFDAVFIGGSTCWKLSRHAHQVVTEARGRGKWTHMGRVNSYRRLRTAQLFGCQSADGTFLRPAPDRNVPRLMGWMDRLSVQGCLLTGVSA